jgi:hypothetical protein
MSEHGVRQRLFREQLIARNADGSTEGRDPRSLPRSLLGEAYGAPPLLEAVREKCLDCACGQPSEVAKCTAIGCALWPFRMAKNPFRKSVNSSAKSQAALAALAGARKACGEFRNGAPWCAASCAERLTHGLVPGVARHRVRPFSRTARRPYGGFHFGSSRLTPNPTRLPTVPCLSISHSVASGSWTMTSFLLPSASLTSRVIQPLRGIALFSSASRVITRPRLDHAHRARRRPYECAGAGSTDLSVAHSHPAWSNIIAP